MLCIAGFDGYFKDLNPAWHKTLGFTTAELKARPFIDFVHPDDRDATNAETHKLMVNIDTVTFENRYLCKDRSYKRLLWNAVALPNERVFYAVVRDITEGRPIEEPFAQAKGDAEKEAQVKRIVAKLVQTDGTVLEAEPAAPMDAEPEAALEPKSEPVDLPQADSMVEQAEPATPIEAEPEAVPEAKSKLGDFPQANSTVEQAEPATPIEAEPEAVPEAKSNFVDFPQADNTVEQAEPATPIEAKAGAAQRALTVLYIEDTLSNLSLIQRLFDRRPEVKIVSAMEGRLGLDMAREHHPDLVLLDLRVTDMKGDEVLARLRTDPETRSIPVIVISTSAVPSEVKHLLGIGARDYLTKPFDVGKFFAAVDAALGEPKPDVA
jgi:PAS domain S-box-containing protein